MNIKIETESKYYCMEPEKLIDRCEKLGFKKIKNITEDDEYFTDIDSLFIKNRTCLRIRKVDNKDMEVTFKGKSLELLGQYSKLENSITTNIKDYENYISLFGSLGYYSYVNVNKERLIYSYDDHEFIYSVMIDKINGIGGFVEFELIANQEDFSKDTLMEELNNFVHKFDGISLREATEPYRDITAKHIYKKYFLDKDKELYINVDEVIINLEKDFYKKNKTKISEILGNKIKWGQFKLCDSKELEELVDDYFANKIFNTNELLVIFKLLEDIDYKKHFITKANKYFYKGFLKKLNIDIKDIIYDDKDLPKEKIKTSIYLNGDLKSIVQSLLIIINVG